MALPASARADQAPYFRMYPGREAVPVYGPPVPGQTTNQNPDAPPTGEVRGVGDLAVWSPIQARARTGVDFVLRFRATNAEGAVTWTSVGDALPPGLSLGTDGVMVGKPQGTGGFDGIRLMGVDGAGKTGTTQPFRIDVKPVPTVTMASSYELPPGKAVSIVPTTSDVYGSSTWTLAGTLPAGLGLDAATGRIFGTPEQRGTFTGLVLAVVDADGARGQGGPFDLVVDGTMDVDGVQSAYAARTNRQMSPVRPQVHGNQGTVQWAVSDMGQPLPSGLTLDPNTGVVTGASGLVGTYSPVVIRAQDTATGERAASRPFAIRIGGAPAVTASSVAGRVGSAVSMVPVTTGVLGGGSWSFDGAMPSGLSVDNATGTMAGTLATEGTASGLVLSVTDLFDGASASSAPFSVTSYPALALQAPDPAGAGVGSPYEMSTPSVHGLRGVARWTLIGDLPPGLAFSDSDGRIAGTPTAAGDRTFTYQVRDTADDAIAKATVTVRVVPGPVTFDVSPMAASYGGTVGKAFSVRPGTVGQHGPLSWTLQGSVPGWLGVDASTGLLSGVPDAAGRVTGLRLTATDGTVSGRSKPFDVTVVDAAPLTLAVDAVMSAQKGVAFASNAPTAAHSAGGLAYTLASGTLPPGLTLAPLTGVISGTPASAGTFDGLTLRAQDAAGSVAVSNRFVVAVAQAQGPTAAIDSATGTVGSPLATAASGQGLAAPVTWSVASGSLPAWARLDAGTGRVSGTPDAMGVTDGLALLATDAQGSTATTPRFQLKVVASPVLTASLQSFTTTLGQAVSTKPTVVGSRGTVTWARTRGTLPDGLSIDPVDGRISGTPTTMGTSNALALTAHDGFDGSESATPDFSIQVLRKPVSVGDPPGPFSAHAGQPLDLGLPTARDALGSVSWTATALPDGLALDAATGRVSGTPTTKGTPKVRLTVRDAYDGTTASGTDMTVSVLGPPVVSMSSRQVRTATMLTATPSATDTLGALTWALASGVMPPWASLDTATGTLKGTPPQAGTWDGLSLRVTDAGGGSGTSPTFSLSAADAVPEGLSASLPRDSYTGRVGKAFATLQPQVGGATGAVTWSVATGTLPGWASIDPSTGVVSGLPTAAGNTVVTLRATQAEGGSAVTGPMTVSVTPATAVTNDQTYAVRLRSPLAARPVATYAVGQVAWSVASGTLPAWASQDATSGTLSGTPQETGRWEGIVVRATDADGVAGTGAPFVLSAVPGITVSGLPGSVTGRVGNATFLPRPVLTNGIGAIAWSTTGLPSGLSIDPSTGIVSGTPLTAGKTVATITATDGADGAKGGVPVSFDFAPALIAGGASLLQGHVGQSMVSPVPSISGQRGTVSWAQSAGTMPAGLAVDPATGGVSGTATSAAVADGIRARATDASDGATADTAVMHIDVFGPVGVVDLATSYVARVGFAFQASVPRAINSVGAVRWAWGTGATPPAWVSLDPATGRMSGTPPAETATAGLSLTATDATGVVGESIPFRLNAYSDPKVSVAATRVSARVGQTLSLVQTVVGLTGAGSWSMNVVTGGLPTGVTLDASTGKLSGSPAATGTATVVLRVTDVDGHFGDSPAVTVEALPALTLTGLSGSYAGHAGAFLDTGTPKAGGAVGTIGYTLSPSAPDGTKLDAGTGQLSGIPTGATATRSFTLTATDPYDSARATLTYGLGITGPLVATGKGDVHLRSGADASLVALAPTASNAVQPGAVRWSLAYGSLPGNLSVDAATGRIVGIAQTVSAKVTYTGLRVRATDGDGTTAMTDPFSVEVGPTLAVAPMADVRAIETVAFDARPSASGVMGTSMWAVQGLPAGLAWDRGTGAITGVPSLGSASAVPYATKAVVTDSWDGGTAATGFSVTVVPGDPVPDGFAFTDVAGLGAGVTVTSNTVKLSGMNAPGDLSLGISGSYPVRIGINGATPSASIPSSVPANASIVLSMEAAPSADGTVRTATLTVGGVSAAWHVRTARTVPDAFTMPALQNVPAAATSTSAPVTVTGTDAPTTVSISGDGNPQVSVDGGAWGSSATLPPGKSFQARMTPSGAEDGRTLAATVTVGGVSAPWSVSTRDTTPDAFTVPAQTNVRPGNPVTSAPVTITGITATAPVTVSGAGSPRVRIGGSGGTWGTTGNISNGQTAELQVDAPSTDSTQVAAGLTVGGVSSTFSATTGKATPTTFSAPDATGATGGTSVTSAPVILSGMTVDAPFTLSADGQYPVRLGVNGATPSTTYPATMPANATVVLGLDSVPGTDGGSRGATLAVNGVSWHWGVRTTDMTPTAWSIPASGGASGGASTRSAPVTLTGMTDPAPLTVTSGGSYPVRIGVNGATPTTPPATVPANPTLVIEMDAEPGSNGGTRTATVGVNGVTASWSLSTADTTPDAFTVPVSSNAAGGASVQSQAIKLSGMTAPAPVSVTGTGGYAVRLGVNGGTPSAAIPSTVPANASLVLGLDSVPGTAGGTRTATLKVGGVSTTWSVTTVDTTPDAFGWASQATLQTGSYAVSESKTITGLTSGATASVSGPGSPVLSVDGGAWTAGPTTVGNGQGLRVAINTDGAANSTRTATVNVGGVTGTFSASTGNDVPNAFNCANGNSVYPANGGQEYYCDVTLSGMQVPGSFSAWGQAWRIYTDATGWTTTPPAKIPPNVRVVLGVTAPAGANGGSNSASFSVSGRSVTFTVRTGDSTPDAYGFAAVSGQPLNSFVGSAYTTIWGLDQPAYVSVQGGYVSINYQNWSSGGWISNGQALAVAGTTPNAYNSTLWVTSYVGGVGASWSATTRGPPCDGGGDSAQNQATYFYYYSDVANSGQKGASHWVRWGYYEGRYSCYQTPVCDRAAPFPRSAGYEGRDDNPTNQYVYYWFNPDVQAAGMNAWDHWVYYGQHEHRTSCWIDDNGH